MLTILKHRRIKLLLWLLALDMIFCPALALAKPKFSGYARGAASLRQPPAANALPVINTEIHTDGKVDGVSSIDEQVADDSAAMDIYQEQTNIVVNWESFDVGENASVTFHQEGTNWSALNRIWDANPSAIFGQIKADGRIFLINQNGMIFGPDSKVNAHTLVATSLNITETDEEWREGAWKKGDINLTQEKYVTDDADYSALAAEIVNQGHITADTTGAIFLVAPTVVNEGTVEAPNGQAALVAGSEVSLWQQEGSNKLDRTVRVTAGQGTAVNAAGATLSAERGAAGMYGRVVNQEGLIRTVTALEMNGKIELRATERIETGAASKIIADIADGDETVAATQDVSISMVDIGGLNTDISNTNDLPEQVLLGGSIEAPGGNVKINATEEITLATGAAIDVSGEWSSRSADENELEIQLNSDELSDDFYVREGDLKGTTIYIDALKGTTLAKIDGHLKARELTAKQRFTTGGRVNVNAGNGQIKIEEGARIDFSGGGYNFSDGAVTLSYVRLGDRIFDVADVPEWALAQGDRLELVSSDEARRLGLTTSRSIAAYDEGHDAGILDLVAEGITLKGALDGSVTRGFYQDKVTDPVETIGDFDYFTTMGRVAPKAGSLNLGALTAALGKEYEDYLLSAVTITANNSDSVAGNSYISADILNNAQLDTVIIHANGDLVIESDAALNLAENGTFAGWAARIHHKGTIEAPGGDIVLQTRATRSTKDGPAYVLLDTGSLLSVAGVQKDYFPLGAAAAKDYGRDTLDGGNISISGKALADGVVMAEGSTVDVSGGYAIDPTGSKVVGGDAGTLAMEGNAVILEGEIRGHAMVGSTGGTLELDAANLHIQNRAADLPSHLPDGFGLDDLLPEALTDTLHISAEQIATSGFSNVTLASLGSPELAADLHLSPSRVKYSLPLHLRRTIRADLPITPRYREMADAYMEPTHLAIKANASFSDGTGGTNDAALIQLSPDAALSVTPGGTITLAAPFLDINGALTVLSGKVALASTVINGEVVIGPQAVIDVHGYRRPLVDAQASGGPLHYLSEDGGVVLIDAEEGTVTVENGATIDISGADPAVNTHLVAARRTVDEVSAGGAGAVSMAARNFNIDPEAQFTATTGFSGAVAGGDLTLAHTDVLNYLKLDLELLQNCQDAGFDAMTVSSVKGIDLHYGGAETVDAVALHLGRSLVFDTPHMTNTSGHSFDFSAPYVQISNRFDKYGDIGEAVMPDLFSQDGDNSHRILWSELVRPDEANPVAIKIGGKWLDMQGQILIDGFSSLNFDFAYDIQLIDEARVYDTSDASNPAFHDYRGGLRTLADLEISTDRLYPATQSTFAVQNGYLDGDAWIGGDYLKVAGPGEGAYRSQGDIYSAGGQLTFRSENMVFSDARVVAPMGQIFLEGQGADSRVSFQDESMLSTASDAAVIYGFYKEGAWQQQVKSFVSGAGRVFSVDLEAAPQRAVAINAASVDTEPGTLVDVSGGGTIYAYEFVPSISGSANPLTAGNRYVILPDNSVQLPGKSIYLEGVAGLADGYYSLLPETYAFAPGAVIIERLGAAVPGKVPQYTHAGDPIGVGAIGYAGTAILSTQKQLFAVRDASDVLSEGKFNGAYLQAGDGGRVTVRGQDTALSGEITGSGLEGFKGGTIQLSAGNIYVGDSPSEAILSLDNLLVLNANALANSGFESIELGYSGLDMTAFKAAMQENFTLLQDSESEEDETSGSGDYLFTGSVIVDEGALDARAVGLYAQDKVVINEGALINVPELLVATPGLLEITTTEDAPLTASTMGIIAGEFRLAGRPVVSQHLALGSEKNISFVRSAVDPHTIRPDEITQMTQDFVVQENIWSQFGEIPSVRLVGPGGITFYDGVDLASAGDLAIHTPRVASQYSVWGIEQLGDGAVSEADKADYGESRLSARNISVRSTVSDSVVDDEGTEDGGRVVMAADESMFFGGGDVAFRKISELDLQAGNDLVFGVGSLDTGNANLNITSARITSTYERDTDGAYEVGNYRVNAGSGRVWTSSSGEAIDETQQRVPGGHLAITAQTIIHGGVIDIMAGRVTLASRVDPGATEIDPYAGVFLEEGAKILARGGAQAYEIAGETVIDVVQGGVVAFASDTGRFEMGVTVTKDMSGELVVEVGDGTGAAALVDVSHARNAASDPNGIGYDLIAGASEEERSAWAQSGLLDGGTVVLDIAGGDYDDDSYKSTLFNGKFSGAGAGSTDQSWGRGGRFAMDAHSFDVNPVADLLQSGGFTSHVALRSRSGDMGFTSSIKAEQIKLVADGGAITIGGTLDASGDSGHRYIALYGRDNVDLLAGSLLDASGHGSAGGGDVTVSSAKGWVNMFEGGSGSDDSRIDVSGSGGGGNVTFIAERYVSGELESLADDADANDVKLDLKGTIVGATRVTAEALVRHEAVNNSLTYQTETREYMTAAAGNTYGDPEHTDGVRGRLVNQLTLLDAEGSEVAYAEAIDKVHLIPHLELYSTGGFSINNDWVFSGVSGRGGTADALDGWRYVYGDDREAGVLTIRAANDLEVRNDLVDEAQERVYLVYDPQKHDAWSYNLVAGADIDSADPMAVRQDTGKLLVRDNCQIYTESGKIRFAAGDDVKIGKGAAGFLVSDLSFTLGTYDGDIEGRIGNDLNIDGSSTQAGAIQSHTGDIRLVAGGSVDLSLTKPGTAIRTLGKLTGDIHIDQLLATEGVSESMWVEIRRPKTYYDGTTWEDWKERYADTSRGNRKFRDALDKIVGYAIAQDFWLYEEGGDIAITAGKDVLGYASDNAGWMALYAFNNDTRPDPAKYTAAYTDDSAGTFTGIGTMAGGHVRISAGGDVFSPVGVFGPGDLTLHAGGNLDGRFLVNQGQGVLTAMGSFGGKKADTVLELGRAAMDLKVQGDVSLGTILNSTFAASELEDNAHIGYDETLSRIGLTALTGDLALSGDSRHHKDAYDIQKRLLPPRVALTAGRDLKISNPNIYNNLKFTLAPSANGHLSMIAGRDIRADFNGKDSYAWITMSAAAPEMYYAGYQRPEGYNPTITNNVNDLSEVAFDGFNEYYLRTFENMWEQLDADGREAYRAIYERINSNKTLHEKDLAMTPLDDPGLLPVSIQAGNDIYGLNLGMPKAADIHAGGDIVDLHLIGQNNHGADAQSGYAGDVTSIVAGGDMSLSIPVDDLSSGRGNIDTGIIMRGPGWLVVDAGGSIDLGATRGIQTIGQGGNDRLDTVGTTVLMSAGYNPDMFQNDAADWDPQRMVDFYTVVRDGGLVYSALKQGQRTDPYNERYDEALGIWVPETHTVDLEWVRGLSERYEWAGDLDVYLRAKGYEMEDLVGHYDTYAEVPDENREILAEVVVECLRDNHIDPFLVTSDAYQSAQADPSGVASLPVPQMGIDFDQPLSAGGISMVQSQVLTQNGGSIYITAVDDLNVGLSAFSKDEDATLQTGINAQFAGDIGIYSMGDINVNESRIMTWYGGDITLWSDKGSINAGKGSKTTVSLASKETIYDDQLERYIPKNSPPAVGSGIRLLTHDPDGVFGPQEKANPGNGYLFAPDGEIDAGEAGIAGRGLLLFEAQRLVNVQNIESVGISIGVAAQTDAGADIGNLSGVGALSETTNASEDAGVMRSTQDRFKDMVEAMSDSLVPRWLAVEVTGFGGEEEAEGQGSCDGLTGAALQKCLEGQMH